MDVGAPLFKLGMFGEDTALAVAAVLGVGFGFFLEQAGFGSARKLTAQFYLRDLAVLKVMFTAIVTAMVGVHALWGLGWLDFPRIAMTPTYYVPQAIGGLVFGVGFVVGGYCPGTAVAGLATGRLDAGVYALGMLSGIALFSEGFDALFKPWVTLTAVGRATLPNVMGLPPAAVVVAVLALALAAFLAAERIEARFRLTAQAKADARREWP